MPRQSNNGVPLLLPDGTTRPSRAALARELGCAPSAIYPYIVDQRGGYAVLCGLPSAQHIGRRGGPTRRRALMLDRMAAVEAAVAEAGPPSGRRGLPYWRDIGLRLGISASYASVLYSRIKRERTTQ